MIGLVLCGGQSIRMGTDKGLMINTKKVTWAQQSFSLLSKLEIPVVISVNKTQLSHYKRIFPLQELILDQTDLKLKGPLLGLLSVHKKYPKKDLFVLACDMGGMQLPVMQQLLKRYREDKNRNAYVYATDKISEPLCAIYTAEGLNELYTLLQNNELHKHSLQYCINLLNADRSPIPDDWRGYFSNFNTPQDLQSF